MYIAQQLKEKNIAEYLLYMWQIEDMVRANGLDMEKIKANIIDRYGISDKEKDALARWYEDIIGMMTEEGVKESGHLQINRNIIIILTDLHNEIIASGKEPFYSAAYFKALPYIIELRNKNGKKQEPEIETCFEALYGIMLLRLQGKEITADTQKAIKEISAFIAMLAAYYNKDKKGELKLED